MFAADLQRLPGSREALTAARKRYERDGVPATERYECHPDHHSGTRLSGCVKVYVPGPGDPWRIVFRIAVFADGRLGLEYLASGLGHTPRHGRRLDVYQLAHHRLNGKWASRER